MGRNMVLGDCHGNVRALQQCLDRCSFDFNKDTLTVIGDICDGYPHTRECIDILISIKNCRFILGNHDQWLLNWIYSDYTNMPPIWTSQGGMATINQYTNNNFTYKVPNEHIYFLTCAKLYDIISTSDGDMVFVHGGIDPNQKDIKKQSRNTLLWDRDLVQSAWIKNQRNKEYKYADKYKIFVGHTTTECYNSTEPLFLCNVVMVDTGAGWGGKLTIMDVDSLEYWQSDSARVLYPNYGAR